MTILTLLTHYVEKVMIKDLFSDIRKGTTQKSARLAAIAEVLVLLRNIGGDSDDR